MPRSYGPDEDGPDIKQPEIRPLSRGASKILVVVAALLAIAVSLFAAYMLINAAREARTPLQETEASGVPPDTTARPGTDDRR